MTTVSSTASSSYSTAASTGASALQSTGSGTGIDYSALVEAAVAKRLAPADRIDQTITRNDARIAAYTELQTLLQGMNDALTGLRNRTASTGGSTNLFDQRAAYLSSSTSSVDPGDVLSITAADGAETGTHTIEVQQLATRHKIGSGTQTSNTAALGLSGTVTIGVEGGTAVTISVNETDSLTAVRDAINAQKAASGVTASIIKVSDGAYQLILTANDTGKAIALSDGSGPVLAGLGLVDESGAAANELVAVQDAVVVVDGVTITRSSNTIDDAIDGLTIDLYAAQPGTTITAEVSTDLSSIKSAITAFVDAYNSFREFALAQQATAGDGTRSDDATLFADSLLRQTVKSVYQALNTKVSTGDGSLSLADLGLSFDANNYLELNETTLNAMLVNNVDGVRQLLGLTMTASSGDLQLLRYTGTQASLSFTLDITMAGDGRIASASVGGDDSLFGVSGSRIIGNAGTAYEGITLVYTGSGGSVDVGFTQGIADGLYTMLNALAAADSGSIATLVSQLESTNTRLTTKSDDIKDQAETYRTRLTAYYARLEAAAEAASILLQRLQQQADSDDD